MRKSTNVSELHTMCSKRGEVIQVGYADRNGSHVAFLTRKGDTFYMYAVNDGGVFVKLGKGKDPRELEERCEIRKLCGVNG